MGVCVSNSQVEVNAKKRERNEQRKKIIKDKLERMETLRTTTSIKDRKVLKAMEELLGEQ
jgi:hypothetical protein